MKNVVTTLALAASVLVCSHSVSAEEASAAPASNTDLLLSLGVTYGGDKLATISYDDGDDVDIHGGDLVLFGIGALHQFGNNWEAQPSVNYQFDRANARNGDATFDRIPLDLLGFYRVGAHRFGGGITYHLNPKFDSDFDFAGGDGTVDFDNAVGAVVEYDYFFNEHVSLGLRYTSIKYKSDEISDDVDGSYGGLMLNGYF
jgi:outer membrane protein with beta-barrel domain